jgi:urease subunit beta
VRPGEIFLAQEPVRAAEHARIATVAIRNGGRFDAYLTSHFAVVRASGELHFDRSGLEGARPLLPAGASVRIPAGEVVEVQVTWT